MSDPKLSKPRILLYDIETSPNVSFTWSGLYDQTVIKFVREWRILCVTWKWLGEKSINYCGQDSFPTHYRKNPDCDLKVVQQLHDLFDQADVTIGHNGDAFDRKKTNSRFLFHKMKPPSPYRTIDTLKLTRRHFKFNSNKLTDLGKTLGIGEKVATGGFNLWDGCMKGCPKSWAKMQRYAKGDIRLLEKLYFLLLPWIDNHPNYGLYSNTDEPTCTNCGSLKLIKRGTSYAYTQAYQRYQCTTCGKYSKSTKSMKSVKIK